MTSGNRTSITQTVRRRSNLLHDIHTESGWVLMEYGLVSLVRRLRKERGKAKENVMRRNVVGIPKLNLVPVLES